jgi:crotonobetainyl-CoA:carnitine CoA-transferase CaiB-like acyl-CoA transferase
MSALAAPAIRSDERFRTRQGRIDNYEALGAALDAQFSGHTLQHWIEHLGANDVPFAPINRIDQVVQDPQVRHLGLVVPVEGAHGGKQAVRPAVQFDGERATHVTTAPLLDEHGADIRRSPWTS